MSFTRRHFIGTSAALLGTGALPFAPARAQTTSKYIRYNATSAEGQTMLGYYATAIQNMMALPPTDARNWFRNAFIHTLDCPHMNWWFFVWHRGYLGWFEQTVRRMSGHDDFAFPYWDWSQTGGTTPGYCIPEPMLSGYLTPISDVYNPYISSFDTFYNYLNPAMEEFWKTLSDRQLAALTVRKMDKLDEVWAQVKAGMFQSTPNARYLRTGNSCLDEGTQEAVSEATVDDGLSAPTFAEFNSGPCKQHSLMGETSGVLESQPHNLTHNNIGGYQHVPNSEVGFMADNLSPVDPIFFLHHSNMDRLWDVWTRKQQSCKLPYLPEGDDWKAYAAEQFMFYVNDQNQPVTQTDAGSYVDMKQFDYTYQPGTGENMIGQCPTSTNLTASLKKSVKGAVKGGVATLAVAPSSLKASKGHPVILKVKVPYPATADAPRSFSVLVNAPPGNTDASTKSPYYAGSVAFFGFMPGMAGMTATFEVPLSKALAKQKGSKRKDMTVQVLPQAVVGRKPPAPSSTLEAASVSVW
ncbi:MAG TPA: tyrosinase family protein [Rhizomicrobium sp.]|nr:tyrosinase family protein [Rhizomicrobium sp.]